MKSYLIFSGSGPILILTTYDSIQDPKLVDKIQMKGITKFIAYELSLDLVQKLYGERYTTILQDVHQTDDLRVLDYDGHKIFLNISFSQLGNPIFYEPPNQ